MTAAERRLGWVAAVHAAFAETRQALVRPSAQALDGILPRLEQAADVLTRLQRDLPSADAAPEFRPALTALGGELGRARALLDTAAGWHAGWARLLYAAACGYTANGEPAAPPPGRSLSVEA